MAATFTILNKLVHNSFGPWGAHTVADAIVLLARSHTVPPIVSYELLLAGIGMLPGWARMSDAVSGFKYIQGFTLV